MSWETTRPSLLDRVRDPADHDAWIEFDRRYGDLIVRYCRSRGLQHTDAEDLRQFVMMSLASALRRFRYEPARGRFRTYLGRVVRNAVIRHHAHRSRPGARPSALDDHVRDVAVSETDAVDELWEREWVRHHLRQAMIVIRRSYEAHSVEAFDRLLAGASPARVAEELGMTVEAVHKVKQRIRNRLHVLIATQVAQEDGGDAHA